MGTLDAYGSIFSGYSAVLPRVEASNRCCSLSASAYFAPCLVQGGINQAGLRFNESRARKKKTEAKPRVWRVSLSLIGHAVQAPKRGVVAIVFAVAAAPSRSPSFYGKPHSGRPCMKRPSTAHCPLSLTICGESLKPCFGLPAHRKADMGRALVKSIRHRLRRCHFRGDESERFCKKMIKIKCLLLRRSG